MQVLETGAVDRPRGILDDHPASMSVTSEARERDARSAGRLTLCRILRGAWSGQPGSEFRADISTRSRRTWPVW